MWSNAIPINFTEQITNNTLVANDMLDFSTHFLFGVTYFGGYISINTARTRHILHSIIHINSAVRLILAQE